MVMITADSKSVGRFDQKLAVQRLFPSLRQLKSQLPQAQKLATRQLVLVLVPYIVRDGQLQCGIGPTAPSMTMTHPARRVMPNGPVGRLEPLPPRMGDDWSGVWGCSYEHILYTIYCITLQHHRRTTDNGNGTYYQHRQLLAITTY
jgi:hypothetical protein